MVALIEEKLEKLADVCRSYGVRRLELFGSAANADTFDPARSDLDFLVEFAAGQDFGPWLRHYFAFKEELERLFCRPVDLVMQSALRNPQFIRNVDQTRTVVYAA